ncbi:hypothetical protein Pfo_023513 [Paulownia fortunei]|nr:hypothetical protein Pfo_023513 [Paulownia fortunei]
MHICSVVGARACIGGVDLWSSVKLSAWYRRSFFLVVGLLLCEESWCWKLWILTSLRLLVQLGEIEICRVEQVLVEHFWRELWLISPDYLHVKALSSVISFKFHTPQVVNCWRGGVSK